MNGRLNSYQKALAQASSAPVVIEYTVTFKALTEYAKPYFDVVQASKGLFNETGRNEPLSLTVPFRYKCPHETEHDRKAIVYDRINLFISNLYPGQQFVSGVDYDFEVIKNDLIKEEHTEPIPVPTKPKRFSFFGEGVK